MLKAAENLEFEEAARLRDEIKRLEAVELAVADDPLARQSAIEAEVEARRRAALEGRARRDADLPGQEPEADAVRPSQGLLHGWQRPPVAVSKLRQSLSL